MLREIEEAEGAEGGEGAETRCCISYLLATVALLAGHYTASNNSTKQASPRLMRLWPGLAHDTGSEDGAAGVAEQLASALTVDD